VISRLNSDSRNFTGILPRRLTFYLSALQRPGYQPVGVAEMPNLVLFGPGLSGCCTVLSVFGVIILCGLGNAFYRHAEVLLGHKDDPTNGQKVADMCYTAAIVYGALVVFCGCQLGANRRRARNPGAVRL